MPSRVADTTVGDAARLEALTRLGLLDAPKQSAFERMTRLVCHMLQVPIALVTLVDQDRQILLSAEGLPEPYDTLRETPLTHSLCQHVVNAGDVLRVEDANRHPAVRDNQAISQFGITAYLGMPIVSLDGHVLGALCAIDREARVWTAQDEGILADLAAMASTEFALRELASQLEARIRTEALARQVAQEELSGKRRLEALGQLAGGVAHDFANVLQSVQAGVRMAGNNLERDPAKARRMLDAVAEAARRGGSITRRLLGFARRGELRVRRVAVAAVLVDLQEVLTHTLNRPGLRITVDTEPGLPPVLVDRGELETVVVNLATNARDAMPSGGELTLSAALETVEDETQGRPHGLDPGTYVRLAASDNGAGMSEETLARASEPFFTTKPEGEGTGLGLAMARDFAVQAGGGFALASTQGEGTTVTLWLPAIDPTSAAASDRIG